MLRIAITDDHTLFRKSLSLLVGSFENIQVVVEASNGKELLEKLKSTTVDILLLDLQMPEMNGFETSRKISEQYPDIKVLILTLRNEEEAIKKVMEQGVHGYFTKDTDPLELKNAILKLHDDGFYFEKSLTSVIQHILDNSSTTTKTREPHVFTEREMDIVRLTLKEYSGTQIAYKLCISPKTVEKHKRNLMEKTDSKNFIGVIMYALLNDFISLNEVKN
ncbi:MAG TPA: response regulator transcription factor [Flavobacterium sp.]|jgi:DNA-binding NarL/FixJ family response regulator